MKSIQSTAANPLERFQLAAYEKSNRAARIVGSSPRLALMLGLVGVTMLAVPEISFAGVDTTGGSDFGSGDGDEFEDVWSRLVGWTQGTLGRIIALTLILVGAAMGVVRQSLITFVVGIAMGLGLYNAPAIIDAVMGATLEDAPLIIETSIHHGLNALSGSAPSLD